MMRITLLLIALLALVMPFGAYSADLTAPMMYSRATLNILRRHPPQVPPLPWQDTNTLVFADPAVAFDIEVRDAAILYNQAGWFNLGAMQENYGVLMVFHDPGAWPITRRDQYAPLDILLIDVEGKITQIVPSIKLASLQQDIIPDSRSKAFFFVNGGTCEKLSIRPGDYVEYGSLFKKPPLVLGTPEAAAPSPPVVTQPSPVPVPTVAAQPEMPQTAPVTQPLVMPSGPSGR